jgi:NAD(P)H-dependent FMN reductase
LKQQYNDHFEIQIYNKISELAHFNPELEKDLPKEVAELRKLIELSDGVLFCTPEYVFSLPGSLKNMIEWNVSTTLFSGKPVAMIIAAASGKKAYESLALILTTIECVLPETSKLLIQGARGKINKGRINDQEIIVALSNLMFSLKETILTSNKRATKFKT